MVGHFVYGAITLLSVCYQHAFLLFTVSVGLK